MESTLTTRSNLGRLFTEQHGSYERFIRFVRYPQGIRDFFLQCPLIRSGLPLAQNHAVKTGHALLEGSPHPVEVRLHRVFGLAQGAGDGPNRLPTQVL